MITSLSFLASCFVTRIELLYLTLGIGTGFGTGLVLLVNFTIIPHYFNKRLDFATGVTQSGKSIGLFVFSALNQFLLSTYGFAGSLLILSALSLNLVPIGMLMIMDHKLQRKASKDIEKEEETQLLSGNTGDMNYEGAKLEELAMKSENVFTEKNNESDVTPLTMHEYGKKEIEEVKDKTRKRKMHGVNQKDECRSNGWTKLSVVRYLGLDLFNNKMYVSAVIASGFVTLPTHITPAVLPQHLLWTGASPQNAASVLVIIGIASICSRLLLGILSLEQETARLNILIISRILSGTSLICCLVYNTYWMYVIFSMLFGITSGILVIYFTLLMVHIVGKHRSHHGFGINYSIQGIVLLIGMPLFGALADRSFNAWGYNLVFIYLGAAEIISGLLFFIIRLLLIVKT